MQSEDQRLQDLFPLFSTDISRVFHDHVNDPLNHVADAIDGHISAISDYLRKVIESTSWIPDSVKLRGPVVPNWQAPPPPPPGLLVLVQRWLSRNRAVCAATISFIGTGAFLIWRRRRFYRMKRRANKAADGSKVEVIVLAGSPYSYFASTLALDLDRRGFIVYITVSSRTEERAVKALQGKDIRPLCIDLTSPSSIASAVTTFSNELLSSSPHNILRLASLIFLPPQVDSYQNIPFHSIASSTWSSAFNSQVFFPFTLAHAFLPLLSAFAEDSQPRHHVQAQRPMSVISSFVSRLSLSYSTQGSRTSLIVLSSSITPSLCPANYSVENVTFASISAWLTTLQSELATNGSSLRIIHMRLGSFSNSNTNHTPNELAIIRQSDFDPKTDSLARGDLSGGSSDLYPPAPQVSSPKGTVLSELHYGVFDAVTGANARHGGTLYLGQGSLVYAMIGNVFPRTIMGWMISTMRREGTTHGSTVDSSDASGDGSSSQGSMDWEDINVSQSHMSTSATSKHR